MYISIGSSCNICVESRQWRASVIECGLDGKNCEVFASGTRNAVGIVWHDGKLWATENARDWAGNDVPPDEINVLEKGKHYGWPYCYGKNIPDPNFNDASLCISKAPSAFDIQAHSAPLGMMFYSGEVFPEEYQGDLFVAYHGSWNRDPPTGYKIVQIDTKTGETNDFAAGWLGSDGKVHGRPVDIIESPDGGFYVTDDKAGIIYKIEYGFERK